MRHYSYSASPSQRFGKHPNRSMIAFHGSTSPRRSTHSTSSSLFGLPRLCSSPIPARGGGPAGGPRLRAPGDRALIPSSAQRPEGTPRPPPDLPFVQPPSGFSVRGRDLYLGRWRQPSAGDPSHDV